jgi:regulation of enolase protein 1 (concanavalin A-like superfamily)
MVSSFVASRRFNEPFESSAAGDRLTIAAGPATDWFADPAAGTAILNAPALLAPVRGDFLLSACVEVEFAASFDAGALVLWHDERCWAKLCFEYSPDREPMVVSVVTRGSSDDCNSLTVAAHSVWLRVARVGAAYAFHASTDGRRWQFVRHFRLGGSDADAGFEAQSPTGQGCRAAFSAIRLEAATLPDLRSGE